MAEEEEFLGVPAKCLTQMTEIVEVILRFASGRCLESAFSVCTLWRDTVQRIRKTRRDCVTLTQPMAFNKLNPHKPFPDFLQSLSSIATEPQAALLFAYVSSSSSIPYHMKGFTKYLKLHESVLPKQCVVVGCATPRVFHFGKNSQNNLSKTLTDVDNNFNAMVLIPRASGVRICSFHLPLRNKYKSISGIDSFLPDMELPAKVVLLFANPLSLGKLTNFALKVKKKYGGKTVIAGCYSDNVLFNQSTATFREIVGLVFAGRHLRSASIIVNGSRQNEVLENLHQGLVRLKTIQIPTKNAMALMFTPPAHRHLDVNIIPKAFQYHFAGVPIVVVDGTAVYGCDTVELERQTTEAGGRDFLHTQAAILCMFSLAE